MAKSTRSRANALAEIRLLPIRKSSARTVESLRAPSFSTCPEKRSRLAADMLVLLTANADGVPDRAEGVVGYVRETQFCRQRATRRVAGRAGCVSKVGRPTRFAWQSPEEVRRSRRWIATRSVLHSLFATPDRRPGTASFPDAPIDQQQVVLTVSVVSIQRPRISTSQRHRSGFERAVRFYWKNEAAVLIGNLASSGGNVARGRCRE